MIKQLVTTVITAAAGASGKETVFGGGIAVLGVIAAALGGWDIELQILLYCMVFDYITGVLAAWKLKKVDSDVMLWGGVRKLVVLGVIALCVLLDQYFGNNIPVPLEAAAFYFYLGREGLSIVENLGKLNILVPEGVKEHLQQLKGTKNDKAN